MLKNPPFKTQTQGSWPEPGRWTYADYQQLPDDGNRYEVLFGALYVMGTPNILHQMVVFKLVLRLGDLVEEKNLGILLPAPTEVILSDLATPAQPDLLFVSQERREIVTEARVEGPPDLVVEVLSPSTIRHDRFTKFNAYEDAGVPEYWIVNPKTQTVEVYQLAEGEYTLAGEYGKEEQILSPLFGPLNFTAGSLFEG